jgi:hypothetical protein
MNYTFDPGLQEFYRKYGKPGRIGLVHFDFKPALLINWGQKKLTRDGKPSRVTHAFFFIEGQEGIPWIAESDVNLPLPGFHNRLDGPQINSSRKWSTTIIDDAVIVDPVLSDDQYMHVRKHVDILLGQNLKYGLIALIGTWFAIRKQDLSHRSIFHRDSRIHCSQFVRECLRAAGVDPWGDCVASFNLTPEAIYQEYPAIADWTRRK